MVTLLHPDVPPNDPLLRIGEVAQILNVARNTVDNIPWEILPYTDVSLSPSRRRKRYLRAHVDSAPRRMWLWSEARQRGEGHKYLKALRKEWEDDQKRRVA